MSKRVCLIVSAAIALVTEIVSAQTPAAAPSPAFEVASIKLAGQLDPSKIAAGKMNIGMKVDGAMVNIGFLSLADLIPLAYRVKAYQVSGPDWMKTQRFDIQGKIPEGVSKDQVPEMLQALLAERFKLAIHRENKEHPVYALVVAKGGPKLKESPPDEDAPKGDGASAPPDGQNDQVKVSREGNGAVIKTARGTTRMTMGQGGAMHLEMSKVKIADFAEFISRFLDRPIVDMTELKGNYQVAVDLTMDDLRNVAQKAGFSMPAPGGGGATEPSKPSDAASDPSGSTLFQAVQQLGLKLESRKLPVETIFVDHVEKTPTEN